MLDVFYQKSSMSILMFLFSDIAILLLHAIRSVSLSQVKVSKHVHLHTHKERIFCEKHPDGVT